MVQLSSNSLSDFLRQTLTGFRAQCRSRGIKLELNIEDVNVPYQNSLVRTAVIALMESSIASTPDGGEIEVNLIDCQFQWELEVADSGSRQRNANTTVQQNKLEAVSLALGASVQTWNCPLGGIAHVLIVPKRGQGIGGNESQRRKAA